MGHEHKGTMLEDHPPISHVINFVTYMTCMQLSKNVLYGEFSGSHFAELKTVN